MNAPCKPAATALPDPDDRPGSEVVIYDGHCQFCTRQVERLARWDGAGRLSFLSLHDPRVAVRYPDLSHEQLMQEMYVVRGDGQRLGGAAAFRYLTRRLPRLWLLAPVMHIPFSLPLWKCAYRAIARRRYRWNQKHGDACDGDSCSIHFR